MAKFTDSIKNITAIEFYNRIFNGTSIVKIGDSVQQKRVKGIIELNDENYSLDELYLTNLVFEDTVRISGSKDSLLNIGSGIIFHNCTFLRPLVISCCQSKDLNERHFVQKAEAIRIINGSYILIQISNCNFPFGVEIYAEERNKLEIDWFESQFNHFSSAGYNFENVRFISKLDITSDTIENIGIDFRNCFSSSPIRISSTISTSIAFTGKNSLYENDVRIWGGRLGNLLWNDGKFNAEISIVLVAIRHNLSILGSEFSDKFIYRRIELEGQNFNQNLPLEIWIQDSKFQNGIEFHGESFCSDKLTINFSEKSSGVIDFRNTFFKEVLFKGINFNNSVFLRDCSYDRLTFSHFFNKALISLNNNNPDEGKGNPEQLLIENSNLGNTEFYDFDFSIYPSVRIIDSRLDSIFTYGATWFENGQLNVQESEGNRIKILSQQREIFRQLKLAAEKQSDRITALDFKAREVEIHAEIIKGKNVSANQSFKNWLIKIGDLTSIWIGKTNDHGHNWIKPLLLILGVSTAFFLLLFVLADPEISIVPDLSNKGFHYLFAKAHGHLAVWPQLFNPTRRVSDMFKVIEHPFWVYFLDGLQRIILAFFIFQIVSAFRKFVK